MKLGRPRGSSYLRHDVLLNRRKTRSRCRGLHLPNRQTCGLPRWRSTKLDMPRFQCLRRRWMSWMLERRRSSKLMYKAIVIRRRYVACSFTFVLNLEHPYECINHDKHRDKRLSDVPGFPAQYPVHCSRASTVLATISPVPSIRFSKQVSRWCTAPLLLFLGHEQTTRKTRLIRLVS